MSHMKRLTMPSIWPLSRKQRTFVISPLPGPHPKRNCIPLQVMLRDILKLAKDAEEARRVIKSGKVLVDKKSRKEPGFPAGLMDVIELPDVNMHYRVGIDRRGLVLSPISQKNAGTKLCRIQGKRVIRGGAIQLSLHDGRNMIVEKGSDLKPGDSVVIQLPDQKIVKSYRLAKGSPAIIFSGRNMGATGTVKEIVSRKTILGKSTAVIKTKDGREIQTLKEYVMVGEA